MPSALLKSLVYDTEHCEYNIWDIPMKNRMRHFSLTLTYLLRL